MRALTFPRETQSFLLVKALYYVQSGLFGVLIHIYFWRITENLETLVLYYCLFYIAHATVFVWFGRYTKCRNRFLGLRLGMILQMLFFIVLLVTGDAIASWIPFVAILGGIANGIYWNADNTLKIDLTTEENRLQFSGIHNALKYGIGALAPLAAAAIVIQSENVITAYAPVFLIALLCTILCITMTFRISTDLAVCKTPYRVAHSWKLLWQHKAIRWGTLINFCVGLAIMQPIAITLILFLDSGSELTIGWYQLLTLLLAFSIPTLVAARFSRKDYRWLLLGAGALQLAAVGIVLWSQEIWAILLFGVLRSILIISEMPVIAIKMDAFTATVTDPEQQRELRVEYVALLEAAGESGKVIGALILLLLAAQTTAFALATAVVFFSVAAYATKIVSARTYRVITENRPT